MKRRIPAGRAPVGRIVALLVAASLAASFAQEAHGDDLSERVQQVDSLIREGRAEAALERARPLAEEIAQRAGIGESDRRAVGTAASLLALCEAGVGDRSAAAWHWAIATHFRPDLSTLSLDSYGEAGARLAELLAEVEGAEQPPAAATDVPAGPAEDPGFEPPKRLRTSHPQATAAMRAAGADHLLIVGFEVAADGRLGGPEILRSRWPGHAFTTLETIREDWRFEPAKRRGEAVSASYKVTINHTSEEPRRRSRRRVRRP